MILANNQVRYHKINRLTNETMKLIKRKSV